MYKISHGILAGLFIVSTILFSQIYQHVQNGGFESGNGYPRNYNQLVNYCDHWVNGKVQKTPGWYATLTYPDALRVPCNFIPNNGLDIQYVFNYLPKIVTYNGSSFYGGFGFYLK